MVPRTMARLVTSNAATMAAPSISENLGCAAKRSTAVNARAIRLACPRLPSNPPKRRVPRSGRAKTCRAIKASAKTSCAAI